MCIVLLCRRVMWFVRYGLFVFFFQAEDGIRDLVRSRGLGDVYKRQGQECAAASGTGGGGDVEVGGAEADVDGHDGPVQVLSLIHI